MRVLVTGGTGVIGLGVIPLLEQKGIDVRLLSRHAERDVAQFRERVDAFNGDIGSPDSIRGASDGCDVILHIAGIARETPPDVTFQKVNVDGTKNLIEEAERAGLPRFLYISSLGADRGESEYHRSKMAAETLVRNYAGGWAIVRPGNVYGPGDEVISLLLKMVRTLPVIPTIDDGSQHFQPIWFEDLGNALAKLVATPALDGQVYEIAGNDRTTTNDLIRRFSEITGRNPSRVPIPNKVASLAASVAGKIGVDLPIDDQKLTMLQEENVVRGTNSLVEVFGIVATPLDDALRKLADAIPEQLPQDGIGSLEVKRFSTTISGSPYSIDELWRLFVVQFPQLMPVETSNEPEANQSVALGATITLSLPLRGNAQVRVVELENHKLTFATVEGHPLAGAVRFQFDRRDADFVFQVKVFDRSATFFDLIAMKSIGGMMQNATWESVVERVASLAGGVATPVEKDQTTAEGEEANRIERWITDLVMTRKRESDGEELQARPVGSPSS